MAGLAFGAAALGGGFALAAAGYQAGTGFTARHEASHVQQVEATRRYIDGFERAYKEGQVSEDDWLKFLAIRTKAGDDEKTYEDSIEAYKETPMFNVVGKLKRRREVRRKKKALRRSNRSLRSHYDDCSSGASDTSSISASHGSPPRSRAAYSDEDDTQISNWAKMVAASDVDAPLQQKRRRLDDAASLECKDMDEIQCRGLRCLQVLQPRSHIMALAFSPDSTRIVSGSSTGQIQIWDVHDGNFSPGPLIMTGHTELVESVSFSPDGNQIVSGSWDGTLRIWDAQTGICTAGPLAGHSDYIWCAAFSPDGQMVASGSDDTTIRIWDARTGRVVAGPLRGHTDRVRTVSFSPDSKRVVSASYDCTIRVWDARTGATVVGPLKNDNDRAFVCAVFNPDGERLLSVSGGSGTIHSWNAKTGLIMSSSPQRKPPSAARVSFSQDCSYVVWGSKDGTVSITDILTGENIAEPLTGHTDQVNCIAVCPDGSRIASGSYDKTIRIWDVDACRQRYLPKEPVGFYGFY